MNDRSHRTADAPGDTRAAVDQLAEATLAALRAPSVLNTQPWRWRLFGDTAELLVDRDRQLPALDPDGRLLLLSCGIALNHALTALRAGGYAGVVERLPDDRRPDLVARLHRGSRCAPDQRNYNAIYRRHTDRRPFADVLPPMADLDALRAAAVRHGVHLRVLTATELPSFADIATVADVVEHADRSLAADLKRWTTRTPEDQDGLPARTTTPPTERPVPARTFNRAQPPRLATGPGTDRGTAYTVLLTDQDEPRAWLAAGEALSDVWLTLTARGLAASPISEVVEVASARRALRNLLGEDAYPAIGLRIGVPVDPADAPPSPARRSGTDVLGLPGQS
ncbi:Acg family FMN-binding oxidoreductase [Cryptosporangium minutisporangium]|uniref:Nitroreductase family protein n=1 Tax=Cryptosporangium minutisporangium TaxID=113569 RepID=A0ABP6T8W9_9ACTN